MSQELQKLIVTMNKMQERIIKLEADLAQARGDESAVMRATERALVERSCEIARWQVESVKLKAKNASASHGEREADRGHSRDVLRHAQFRQSSVSYQCATSRRARLV